MTGNHMIDGDDGTSCQSPYHTVCPDCQTPEPEQEQIKICRKCGETFWAYEGEDVCEVCA